MRIAIANRSLLLLANALVLALVCGQARADGACDFANPSAFTEKLYQLHKDGSIFLESDSFYSRYQPEYASIACVLALGDEFRERIAF